MSIKSRFTSFLEAIIANREPTIDLKKEYIKEDKSESLESNQYDLMLTNLNHLNEDIK